MIRTFIFVHKMPRGLVPATMIITYTNHYHHHLSPHPSYGKLLPAELLNTNKVCGKQVTVSGYFNEVARDDSARLDWVFVWLGFFVV